MLALFFPFHERFVSQVNDNVLFEYVRYREYIRFDDDENPPQREISLFRRSENRWRVGERSEDRFNKDEVGVGKWFRVGKERICRRKRGRGGGEVAVPNSACFTYTPNSQITFARIRASPRQFGLINIINGGALIQTFFAGCEHMLPYATNCLAI